MQRRAINYNKRTLIAKLECPWGYVEFGRNEPYYRKCHNVTETLSFRPHYVERGHKSA